MIPGCMRAYTAPLYGRTFLSAREIRWHTILCTQPRSRPLERDVKALDKLIIALNDSDGSTFLKITKSRRIYKIAGPTVPCPKTCRGTNTLFDSTRFLLFRSVCSNHLNSTCMPACLGATQCQKRQLYQSCCCNRHVQAANTGNAVFVTSLA